MHWTKGILCFTMAVIMLSSSSRAGPEVFSEMGAAQGAVSESTIRFGKLLIAGQGAGSALRSAEQSEEYWSNEEERLHLAKAKLQHLGSSVHCGNDSMTLRIAGSRMPHFLIDRGHQSPVPLSEMPASCGFSLKRVRRDVSLVAPYQGCHVRQQGGSYVLPLVILGAPVQMSCPMSPRFPTVSCLPSGMIISLDVRADVKVLVDGSWQPLLLICSKCSFSSETVGGSLVVTAPFTGSCWKIKDTDMQLPLMYGDQEVTLSCPVTQPTLAPTIAPADPTDSQQMFYPFPPGKPWWYHPYYHGHYGVRPIPPTLPPTTTTPLQDPGQQMYPMFYPHYFNSKHFPGAPQPQHPRYPKFPPYMYYFTSPFATTSPATTTSTTPVAQFEQVKGYPPMYPKFYGPHPFVPPGIKYPFMSHYP